MKLLSDANGVPNIDSNQLWQYQGFSSLVLTTDAPSPINPARTYSTLFLNLAFQRQSYGIIYRLGLPILIFIIIVGVAFWSDTSSRIEVTLQMILVVSALYIIVGQSIPLVGYLTTIDLFIMVVFIILGLALTVHFLSIILMEKQSRYPMNIFYADCLILFLRTTWLPMAVGIFMYFFQVSTGIFIAVLSMFTVLCVFYFVGQLTTLRRKCQYSVFKLKIKNELVQLNAIDEKTERPLRHTWLESLVLMVSHALKKKRMRKKPSAENPFEPMYEEVDDDLLEEFNTLKPDLLEKQMERAKHKEEIEKEQMLTNFEQEVYETMSEMRSAQHDNASSVSNSHAHNNHHNSQGHHASHGTHRGGHHEETHSNQSYHHPQAQQAAIDELNFEDIYDSKDGYQVDSQKAKTAGSIGAGNLAVNSGSTKSISSDGSSEETSPTAAAAMRARGAAGSYQMETIAEEDEVDADEHTPPPFPPNVSHQNRFPTTNPPVPPVEVSKQDDHLSESSGASKASKASKTSAYLQNGPPRLQRNATLRRVPSQQGSSLLHQHVAQSQQQQDRYAALMAFKKHAAAKMGVVFQTKDDEDLYVTSTSTTATATAANAANMFPSRPGQMNRQVSRSFFG